MICHTIVEIPNNTGKVEKEVARRSNRNYIGVYERLGLLVNFTGRHQKEEEEKFKIL